MSLLSTRGCKMSDSYIYYLLGMAALYLFPVAMVNSVSEENNNWIIFVFLICALFSFLFFFLFEIKYGFIENQKYWLVGLFKEYFPIILVDSWLKVKALISSVVSIICEWVLMVFVLLESHHDNEKVIRGVDVFDTEILKKKISKNVKNVNACINIGGIPIPEDKEIRHILLAGSPGTGKTTQIKNNLNVIRSRNQRAIILDANGDLMSRLYKKGDVILSADDDRSVSWSILSELKSSSDCPSIASSVIPDGIGESKPWHQYAQVICSSVLEKLLELKDSTNYDFYKTLALDDQKKLAKLVAGTEAMRLFSDGNERMLGSVLSIVSSYLRPYRVVDHDAGFDAWNITDWIMNESNNSWLWITYKTDNEKSTRSLRRTWVDIVMRITCSLPPNHVRRNWLVLDELRSADYLPGLPEAAARGRKHGLSMILGFQSVSQLREIYGSDITETVLSCAGNKAILRTEDPDTAEYLSRMIGDQEIEREQKSHTYQNISILDNKAGNRPNHTNQKVREIKRAVLSSEIMRYKDLTGIAKISGYGWAPIKINILEDNESVIEPYIEKVRNTNLVVIQESQKNILPDDDKENGEVSEIDSVNKIRLRQLFSKNN